MSRMGDLLAPTLPEGIEIPPLLERAWTWMEERGFGGTGADGDFFLSPHPEDQEISITFHATGDLEGWFPEGFEASNRLAVIGDIGGDGSQGALWLDDEGRTRFVALGSEGACYLLADTVEDFLRLVAIGYVELDDISLGSPPDEDEAYGVEALAVFREWVTTELGLDVPTQWPEVGGDDFSAWMERELEAATPEPTTPEDTLAAAVVGGDAARFLDLVGQNESPELLAQVAEIAGFEVPEDVERFWDAYKAMESAGIDATTIRGDVYLNECLNVYGDEAKAAADHMVLLAIKTWVTPPREEVAPYGGSMVDGVGADTTYEEILERFGEPDEQSADHPKGPYIRHVVDGKLLLFRWNDDGLFMINVGIWDRYVN